MKKIILFAAAAAMLAVSCQESLEDRAAREAQEFTRKNCPMKLGNGITTDSMVFDKSTLTLHYCMTISGQADTTAIRNTDIKKDMVEGLKGNTAVRPYKDAGYNFQYTFYSEKHKGLKLYEVKITKKDYSTK